MFTFALAFWKAIDIFLSIFNLFLLFMERGRRNLEESIHNENHWAQLLHVSGIECHIDCFAAYFLSFPKENAFQSLEENLRAIKRKQNSLTFSWPWKISTFPWPWQPCYLPSKKIYLSWTTGQGLFRALFSRG